MGSFWWKDVLHLSTMYIGISRCDLVDRHTFLFWDDYGVLSSWPISSLLYSLLPWIKSYLLTIAWLEKTWPLSSILPLSEEAYTEWQEMHSHCHSIPCGNQSMGRSSYIRGNGTYISKGLSNSAFSVLSVPSVLTWLWKSAYTKRLKFFAQLLLVDRLNMRDILARRNYSLQLQTLCVLCNNTADENHDHLLQCTNLQHDDGKTLRVVDYCGVG